MRKIVSILFSASLIFFLSLPADAGIVSWNLSDDGVIVVDRSVLTNTGVCEYDLEIGGSHVGNLGHLFGEFVTDADPDPTVRILEDVENDTTFAWTDYHIAIGMNKTFTILETGLMMPDGWTAVITPVASDMPLPSGGTGWVGMVDFYQGTGDAVVIGDTGTFGFKVNFDGSVQYCTQQYPTPEPATLALLGLGAFALRRRK
jgi:hypothetical protein